MNSQKIIAVTVNWNRADDTIACLQTLQAQSLPLNKIVVIDNDSDEEPSFVSLLTNKLMPGLEVIETGKNLGFGAGANVGIKRALDLDADYVLVINNDTIADTSMLEQLVSHSKKEGFDISAPLIYYAEPANQVWSSGGNVCPLIGLPFDAHHRKKPLKENTRRSFLTGCCLLISRKAIERVGLFDESYFMYYEDLDYSMRANEHEVSMGVVPSAELWHKEAQSSGGYLNPNERYWSAKSLMRYSKKATTWWNAIPLWSHRVVSTILWTHRLLLKGKPNALKAYWKGIQDGLCNKGTKN